MSSSRWWAAAEHYARKIKRAQILLAADSGLSDHDIAAAVAVGGSTGYRTKRRFVEGNLEAALNEEPRAGADRKLTSNEEALLVATACSSPPEDPTEPWQEEHQPNISLPAEPTKPPVPHVMSQAGLRIRVNKSAAVSVEWLLVVASHAQETRCRCSSAACMLHLRRAPGVRRRQKKVERRLS